MAEISVQTHMLAADDRFPNNRTLPLLHYKGIVPVDGDVAAEFERRFATNGWGGCWRNGVYPFHHYHSNAHEALGIASGNAKVQFGGPDGPVVTVETGDLAVLPAGTTHKRVEASSDLLVVGAYPEGQGGYDLLRGDAGEFRAAAERIAAVPLPEKDPVCGKDGPLFEFWK